MSADRSRSLSPGSETSSSSSSSGKQLGPEAPLSDRSKVGAHQAQAQSRPPSTSCRLSLVATWSRQKLIALRPNGAGRSFDHRQVGMQIMAPALIRPAALPRGRHATGRREIETGDDHLPRRRRLARLEPSVGDIPLQSDLEAEQSINRRRQAARSCRLIRQLNKWPAQLPAGQPDRPSSMSVTCLPSNCGPIFSQIALESGRLVEELFGRSVAPLKGRSASERCKWSH